MSDYEWRSYDEVENEALEIGSGLLKLNHKVNERVVIFAETRAKWLISAIACFRYKFPSNNLLTVKIYCSTTSFVNWIVVTVYATLGEEAIAYAINDAEAHTIITTQELVKKVMVKNLHL